MICPQRTEDESKDRNDGKGGDEQLPKPIGRMEYLVHQKAEHDGDDVRCHTGGKGYGDTETALVRFDARTLLVTGVLVEEVVYGDRKKSGKLGKHDDVGDLLQSKAYTRSPRYPPPNSDYESDNSIFSVSSGISTSFSGLSFFSIL